MSKLGRWLDSRWINVLLIPVALAYLLIGLNRCVNVYDEGLAVFGAVRVLQGDVPHRDFWTLYPPGQFAGLAGLFSITGPSLLAERLWSTLIHLGLVFAVYALARRLVAQRYALVAWLLALVWMGTYGYYASPVPPALLGGLLSSLILVGYFTVGKPRRLIVAGALAGLTACVRHDIAIYIFLAHAVTLALHSRFSTRDDGGLLRTARSYLLGLCIVVLPAYLAMAALAGPGVLFDNLFVFPLTEFPRTRSLAFPAPWPDPALLFDGTPAAGAFLEDCLRRFAFYFPFLVLGAAAWAGFIRLRKKDKVLDPVFWGGLLLALLCLACLNQVRVRSSQAHLLAAMLPAIGLFAVLTAHPADGIGSRARRAGLGLILAAVGLALIFPPLHAQAYLLKVTLGQTPKHWYRVERALGIYEEEDVGDYEALIDEIRRRVPPGGRIFVGNERHDRIFINDVLLYFLADRGSATRYHELHPGVATTASVQRKIIDELEAGKVGLVVLRNEKNVPPGAFEGEAGATVLDEYLEEKFEAVGRFGDYRLLTRRAKARGET